MIKPEDIIPFDDAGDSDKDDQMSQQDIHSNGLEEENIPAPETNVPAIDLLQLSIDASEPAYTLKLDDEQPKQGKSS